MPNVQTYLLSDAQLAISKTPETDVNVPFSLAADFEGILCNAINPYIPALNLINDSDQVGDGTEFAKNPRPYNWNGSAITLVSKLNTKWAARMIRRFLAGTQNDALVTTGVYDHTINMQLRSVSRDPLLTTFAKLLGGDDFMLASMGVNSITISQDRTNEPMISVELMGSGFHSRFRDVYRSQVITITGVPTGGTFTLTFDGQVTAAIAYNANAAAVQAALEALSNIAGSGADILVTGGALPATPMTVSFLATGAFESATIPLMTANSSLLTGGTTPTVTISTTTPLLVLPAPPAYTYMHGAKLIATANNGQALDLTVGGLLSWSIRLSNNLEWESLPGYDAFMVPTDVNSGAYMGSVSVGTRTVETNIKRYLDGAADEYYWTRRNLDISNLLFKSTGQRIGSTAYSEEVEIKMPFSKAMPLIGDAEGNRAAKTMQFLPTKDPVTSGIAIGRIRNANATLL